MIARPLLYLTFFLLVSAASLAQNDTGYNAWYHVDTSIRFNRKIEEIKTMLIEWHARASLEQDHIMQARCVYSLIKIADRQSEDSLFWKNSQDLDLELERLGADPLYLALVHIMKAKRIADYKTYFFRWSNKNKIRSYSRNFDCNSLTYEELDNLINYHFEKALNIASVLQPVSARRLIWLSDDPATFLFKPYRPDVRAYSNSLAIEVKE